MMNTPMVDLVGVGLNATDTVIPLKSFPVSGSKVEYQTASVMPGGQVATAVVACQQWGLETRYVGRLGDDEAGALHQRAFLACGVEAQIITVAGGSSAQSLILVDGQGERTVLCRRDEQLTLQPADLRKEWVTNARALLVDGHDTAAATQAAAWAREAGVPVVADLDEPYPEVDRLLQLVDYLIVSRDFPSRLMDEPRLETALVRMQERFGSRLTAATLGDEGVLAWDGRDWHAAAAFRVPAVDTTGAGDIFHAGFIYGLLRGWEMQRRLDFGCAAAALNCTAVGARGGIFPAEEIADLMRVGERHETTWSRVRV